MRIGGMTCESCQNKIQRGLAAAPGVQSAQVSYSTGDAAIVFDAGLVSLDDLAVIIEGLGYTVLPEGRAAGQGLARVAGTLALIMALSALLQHFGLLNLLVPSQLADTGIGYGMLFVVGALTSVHCIAMCGGINLSQSVPRKDATLDDRPLHQEKVLGIGQSGLERKVKGASFLAPFVPSIQYNLGRVVSYALIGGILGFVGFLIGGAANSLGSGAGGLSVPEGPMALGVPILLQGVLKLLAGLFMIVVGVNMLGLFPGLRALALRVPWPFMHRRSSSTASVHRAAPHSKAESSLPGAVPHSSSKATRQRGPFIVGLLNGLMPCGPLQSMQIVALASANPLTGALSLLFFSLGTVPLALGFGSMVAALGKRFAHAVMRVGAILVVVLGLAMLAQGGSLTGFLPPEALFLVALAFCVVGIVSHIPFATLQRRAFATAATAALMGILVACLAVPLAGQGWLIGGLVAGVSGASGASGAASSSGTSTPPVQMMDGRQLVSSTLESGGYPRITVVAGIPVRWLIEAPQGSINGCNNRMLIPEYGIEHAFKPGENVIEFTPTRTGTFRYSCWMGMIQGSITVTEEGA
jgi:sulfite exporter TauE/SafE/copper chaperone CopZ